jgi:hypothetical protein
MSWVWNFTPALTLPQKNILSLVEDPTLVAGRGKDILSRSF